jgi:outer membrane protein W
MKKLIILFAILMLGSFAARSQGFAALHYDVGIPLGNTADAVGKVSFRGIGLDFRKVVTPGLAAGMSVGWQVFYEEKDYATYTDGNASLSGVQFSYLNAIPILLKADYIIGDDDASMRPFVGIGVGTAYYERYVEMGLYSATIDTWQFALEPEAGLLYELSGTSYFFTAAKYMQSFKNSELDAQSYITLNVGFCWRMN